MKLLLFIILQLTSADCPQGWLKNTFWCYKVFEGRENEKSWNLAESYCNQFGADLVDIQNIEEQSFVYSILEWNQRPDSWRQSLKYFVV